MLFSEVLQAMQGGGGEWTATVGEDWLQGRTVFGGLQAALAVQAMRGALGQAAPLRTVQMAFIAPLPAGSFAIQARVLRTGKSATQVEARFAQGGQTLALAIGIFGASRASALDRVPAQPPVPAGKAFAYDYIPGVMPAFLQHFKSRWLRGAPLFSGSTVPEMMFEIDLLDSAATASDLHVLAIADMIPPVALTMLRKPALGSTMTWMVEFLTGRFDGLPLEGWRVDGEMLAARDGYTSQAATVWGPGGEAVAFSQQSMVVFG